MTGSEDTRAKPMPERVPMSGIYDGEASNEVPARAERPALEDLIGARVAGRLDAISREVGVAIAALTLEVPDADLQSLVDEAVRRTLSEMQAGVRAAGESEYLTVEEAAAFLRATPDRIRKLRSRGVLTRYGDGGRALVKRAELEAWIRNEPRRGRR
jgi:excisionase family DNA binding protein